MYHSLTWIWTRKILWKVTADVTGCSSLASHVSEIKTKLTSIRCFLKSPVTERVEIYGLGLGNSNYSSTQL